MLFQKQFGFATFKTIILKVDQVKKFHAKSFKLSSEFWGFPPCQILLKYTFIDLIEFLSKTEFPEHLYN